MIRIRDILYIIVLTIIFSFIIFLIRNYIFSGKEDLEIKMIEEKYIEPQVNNSNTGEDIIIPEIKEEELSILNSAYVIRYTFVPKTFSSEEKALEYKSVLDEFFHYDTIEDKISLLDIELHKDKGEVRGRMEGKKVKLFSIYEMDLGEFNAVGIHEFAHFFDLYILKRENNIDKSDYFYDISWESQSIIKSGMTQGDFVSGYSMTNKYEDFAESLTYYVLHNEDFLEKSKSSTTLKSKYDYFAKYIFYYGEFTSAGLEIEKTLEDYYRDITKIKYSLENFLQYLKI